MHDIGIDIGGMKIKIGVVENDKVLEKKIIDTPIGNLEKLIDEIKTVIDEYNTRYEIKNIGIGVAGQFYDGRWTSDNIKVYDVDLKQIFEEHYGDKITNIVNDASAAAVAELLYGNMQGNSSGLFITFGTGIGGGLIINGRLYEGNNKNAGEIGHQKIALDGLECSCGGSGCYEAYASTKALINRAKKILEDESIETTLREECNNKLDKVDGKMIFNSYHKNDKVIVELINEHIRYMSYGIINVLHVLDIDTIVIGGGISNQSEVIIPKLKEYIKKYKTLDKDNKEYNILVSKFCNEAGLIGAANLYKLN